MDQELEATTAQDPQPTTDATGSSLFFWSLWIPVFFVMAWFFFRLSSGRWPDSFE